MDKEYRKTKRNAIITAILCSAIVIGMYVSIFLLIFPPVNIPSVRKVEREFLKNQKAFYTVAEFLAEQEAKSIIIDNPNGIMQADFQEQKIYDNSVLESLDQLFSMRSDMSIYKHGNTIEFQWWSHWIVDIGSYVAYSTDSNRIPQVQFATETVPMSEPGWYYIIADYNRWRIEN